MAGMSSYKMTINHWKLSSKSPLMQPHPVFSTCYSACRNMTTPFSINPVKSWLSQSLPLPKRVPTCPLPPKHLACTAIHWQAGCHLRSCQMLPSVQHTALPNLQRWPNHLKHVLRIAWHLWGAQDGLSIEAGILLKGDQVCVPPELLNCTLVYLHEAYGGWRRWKYKQERQFIGPASMLTSPITSEGAPYTQTQGFTTSSAHATPRHPQWPVAGDGSQLLPPQSQRVPAHLWSV